MEQKVFIVLRCLFFAVAAARAQGEWPCPAVDDIVPCSCTFSDDTYLDLDCSAVQNDGELTSVFQASFPFNKFRTFNITGTQTEPVPITHFSADLFGDIFFENVYIQYTNLETMDGDPFNKSQNELKIAHITYNQLTTYPFDTLQVYTVLTDLRLHHNNITHIADIISPTLRILDVSNNPGLKYGNEAFHNMLDLRTLRIRYIGLTNVAMNTFRYLPELRTLDLTGNSVHILWKGSFWFESTFIRNVYLSNILDTIEEDGINFCNSSANPDVCETQPTAKTPIFHMKDNLLTDLPSNVWENVFALPPALDGTDMSFDFRDNPIVCGCNIAWLVTNDTYFGQVHPNSTCDNGDLFSDLDPAFFDANCNKKQQLKAEPMQLEIDF